MKDIVQEPSRSSRKVLVIGDDTRSFLATVRSLGRAGIEVHAAPFSFLSPALKSRYLAKTHWLPLYFDDGSEWLQAFDDLLEQERFSLVIPCDERALLPLNQHRKRFVGRTTLGIPDPQCIELLFDKHKTRELAKSLGISVPKGRIIERGDTAQTLIGEAGLPLAIKASSSYTLDQIHARNRVKVATRPDEVAEALDSAGSGVHFFEAFAPGIGTGVSVLAHGGRVLQAFQHRRVHEFQGSSYYRVSEQISPALLDAVNKMMKACAYSGLAMFEFRVDPGTGAWALLEVNARPWGSLPLPVSLGIDFPLQYYRLLVDGVEPPATSYKFGVYGRNVVPDAWQNIVVARNLGGARTARFILKTLGEYMRVLAGREVYDVFVSDDPTPAFYELRGEIREVMSKLASGLPRLTERRRRLDELAVMGALGRGRPRKYDIAFVCQGNICRSPMAAALLEREIDAISDVRISSFGNLPRTGAISPPNAIAAARSWGIDLTTHRSRHLTRRTAEELDLIIVFDETNRNWINERYPDLKTPVVLLGSFLSSSRINSRIADPYGNDVTYFERVYGAIADAVGSLAQQIRKHVDA